MSDTEFEAFVKVVGSLFSLSAQREKAIALRKQLGSALDERFSKHPKGVIEEVKARFISAAKIHSRIEWHKKYQHKIISTLKNEGSGDEQMTQALFFLCCKTREFNRLRIALNHALGKDAPGPGDVAGWPPKVEFEYSRLVRNDEWQGMRKHLQMLGRQRVIDTKLAASLEAASTEELKSTFEYLLDTDLGPDIDFHKTDALIEISMRKNVSGYVQDRMDAKSSVEKVDGRQFVENDAANFIKESAKSAVGTLSIIDIDDTTKINKVFGIRVGDIVIETVGSIFLESLSDYYFQSGRCGDDTFYAVLCGEEPAGAEAIMDRVKSNVRHYAWESIVDGLRVSVSIGIANYRVAEPSIDLAIRAGLGMKNAKKLGGNRVVIGPEFLPHSDYARPNSTQKVWS